MFMGITSYTLEKTEINTFTKQALIVPACTVDPTMIWLYKVRMVFEDAIYERVFEVDNAFHANIAKIQQANH